MISEERIRKLRLSLIKGIGNAAKRRLDDHFSSLEELFSCSDNRIAGLPFLKDKEKACLLRERKRPLPDTFLKKLEDDGIGFTTVSYEDYPVRLLDIHDPPYVIYYKGTLPEEDEKMIALVGSRRCTPYGKETAIALSGLLAKNKISVVSGMALGIDGFSHEGAMSAGGKTYAVLGCGVDVCYPKLHERMYHEIIKNGAVISEFPPGTEPLKQNFPARNRLISGLSTKLVVVEASEKSGSLISADFALEQGRDVYAVPGRIDSPLSAGTNRLIYQGAGIITSPEAFVMDVLGISETPLSYTREETKEMCNLENEELLVYSCLDFYPKSLEAVAGETGLPMLLCMSRIMKLCDRGLIKEAFKNEYMKM